MDSHSQSADSGITLRGALLAVGRLPPDLFLTGVVVFALVNHFTVITTFSMSLYGSPDAIIGVSEECAGQGTARLVAG